MPMDYTIEAEAGLVRIVGSGRLTDDEMLACVRRLREDSRLSPDMRTFSDMRGIEMAFTRSGVERMVALMEATGGRRGPTRLAIVVDSDVAFGMGRMFELSADGRVEPSLRIFRDEAAAMEWLGSG